MAKEKITREIVDQICDAISHGATYEAAAESVSVARSTLYEWLAKGKNQTRGLYRTLSDNIKKAEGEAQILLLKEIRAAGGKDWKALAWIMQRRYKFSPDGVVTGPPEEVKKESQSPLEILRSQAGELKQSMESAKDAQSWQAYAALQRQYLNLITEIRKIEAEENMGDEFNGLTDEQLIQELTGAIVSLPPILRQRLESNITNVLK